MIIPNVYFVFLQDEIISDLQECNQLLVLDAISFFYQWRVYNFNTFKLTIVTHRGQKTFLVLVMRYQSSITYIQRRMDQLLHD